MSEAFAAAHGSEVADIIMEHLPPEGWGDLATKTDVASQGLLLRSDFETQGLLLRRDLETQMSALRSDLESQISTLRTELRADLATGFAQQLKWLVGTMVALFTVVSGLVSVLVVVAK